VVGVMPSVGTFSSTRTPCPPRCSATSAAAAAAGEGGGGEAAAAAAASTREVGALHFVPFCVLRPILPYRFPQKTYL
jgi:hypothetical protein